MTPQDMDRALTSTLADYRLSGGEKKALQALVADVRPDEHQLAVFRSRAFALAREAMLTLEARQVVEWLEAVVKVLMPREGDSAVQTDVHFSPGEECAAKIVHLFGRTRESVDVCVFTITDDRIADAILRAHGRGVRVRIVSDNEKADDLGSDVGRLGTAGIPVRVDRTPYHMHHKFALFDGALLLNGSYNWTRSAAEHNMENFVITDDARAVRRFSDEFARLWERLR